MIELEWAYAILNNVNDYGKIIFCFPKNRIFDEIISLYGDRDTRLVFNTSRLMYMLNQATVLCDHDIAVDVGVSVRNLLGGKGQCKDEYGSIYYKHEVSHRFLEKNKPLVSAMDVVRKVSVCQKVKDIASRPYAVLQIKDIISNGTAKLSDLSLIQALVESSI